MERPGTGQPESPFAGGGLTRLRHITSYIPRSGVPSALRRTEAGHVRRTAPFALLALSGLLLLPATAGARVRSSYRSSTERTVFVLLNDIRREHGLPQFTFSTALRTSAREHSADMLARHYFEHNSPDETFDHRIRRHLDSSLVGENIAWGTGRYATPEGLVQLWMQSPTHRHIILMAGLHRIGLGVAIGSFAGSKDAAMATADFAA
jgi:uncharacterized protein YkwD